jgi:ABC-2 type transport system ATP-binding protein
VSAPAATPSVCAQGLTKVYGDKAALDGLDLDVPPGELFVLLGPNGAGKTTFLRLLATLIRPTRGTAFVCGYDVRTEALAVKSLVGYVPETPHMYGRLTGREVLELVADIRGVRERRCIERLLETFDLAPSADMLVDMYSAGMRKKVALAAALLSPPRVLLLDEPMQGLDPPSARLVRDLLPALAKRGVAVLMTTHVLEVAEKVCQRVGILHEGRLRATGTPQQLCAAHDKASLEDVFFAVTGTQKIPAAADLWGPG